MSQTPGPDPNKPIITRYDPQYPTKDGFDPWAAKVTSERLGYTYLVGKPDTIFKREIPMIWERTHKISPNSPIFILRETFTFSSSLPWLHIAELCCFTPIGKTNDPVWSYLTLAWGTPSLDGSRDQELNQHLAQLRWSKLAQNRTP